MAALILDLSLSFLNTVRGSRHPHIPAKSFVLPLLSHFVYGFSAEEIDNLYVMSCKNIKEYFKKEEERQQNGKIMGFNVPSLPLKNKEKSTFYIAHIIKRIFGQTNQEIQTVYNNNGLSQSSISFRLVMQIYIVSLHYCG